MSRTVQITLPEWQADELLTELRGIEGLLGLNRQRGISILPPGDILTIEITNRGLHPLMRLIDKHGIGLDSSTTIKTSELSSVVSVPHREAIAIDTSDATWEEMEVEMGKESNMTIKTLMLMGICGFLAVIGLATGALHIVLAAMLIAPGFEPFTRIGLGIVTRSPAWRRGLFDALKGYGVLFLAAAVTTFFFGLSGKNPLGGETSYLPGGALITYFTSFQLSSLLVTVAGSVAGAIMIATNRAMLTGGVMAALALIPAAAIGSMGLVAGNWKLGGIALLRWVIEVFLVCLFSFVVFEWKRRRHVRRRKMLL